MHVVTSLLYPRTSRTLTTRTSPLSAMSLHKELSVSEVDVGDTTVHAMNSPTSSLPRKDLKFWMIFLSLCLAMFLSAIELSAVSTALPSIIHDLHGDDFVWVGAAYSLASTAFLPMSGGLAEVRTTSGCNRRCLLERHSDFRATSCYVIRAGEFHSRKCTLRGGARYQLAYCST